MTSSHILLIVNNISMESDDEIADAYNTLIFNYSLETNGGTILSKDYICDENNIGLILSALVGRDFYERRYKELKLTNLNTTSIAAENQPITDFDCEMTEKLTKHNIVCMEDVSLHPRAYFKKMDLSDLEIDYLRLKLESNGLSFYDFDTYIKDLDDNDPHEIEIYDLYVADQINKDLYGVLNENYYYTVADLDYIAFDTLSPITMGNIGVLKNVINKYALHYVETTEELKQVIVNTAGRDLDVYVLFRYLHLDPESQSAVRSLWLKFTREFRGEAKELAYVSDLSLSVKEYTFIMQNKDYAPIAGLILYAQHEIPECFIGVDYANNDTPEEVPYDKECDAENSLIRVITGLLTPVGYDKIKEYVNGIVSDELSVSDKKILAAFITDFLYYMPDIKYITDISNSEKYSPTYSTITSYFKRMGNNHLNMTLDSIGDLIFASTPARRIMMMLLMKYVFTAKDQKNGDPFDMIK